MAIHEVEMEHVGAGSFHILYLVRQAGVIRGQQRRSKAYIHRLTHTVTMSDGATGEPAGGYCRSTTPVASPG